MVDDCGDELTHFHTSHLVHIFNNFLPRPPVFSPILAVTRATAVIAMNPKVEEGCGAAGYLDLGGAGQRKARVALTSTQLDILETLFQKHKYLSEAAIQEISRGINISGTSVRFWFQNRRAELTKEEQNNQLLSLEPKWLLNLERKFNFENKSEESTWIKPESNDAQQPSIHEYHVGRKESSEKGGKAPRTNYTPQQVRALEELFKENKNPDIETRKKVAHRIGLPYLNVKVWFQNRKAKEKKQKGVQNPEILSQLDIHINWISRNPSSGKHNNSSKSSHPVDVNEFIAQYQIPMYIED